MTVALGWKTGNKLASRKTRAPASEACPCGGEDYAHCCGPLHQGAAAATAEALMRSRYSAYVLRLEAYLLASWHPSTRPPALDLSADTAMRWLGLNIRSHSTQGDTAQVSFVARYKIGGRAERLEEHSRFLREDGRWYYVDGDLTP